MERKSIFFSYSRDDSDFVLKLAKDLRKAGAKIWLDQLDIKPGSRWDTSIEKALSESDTLLVILSCSSVLSHNVLDEVSYALEEHKRVVPVRKENCDIPFRLRRLQYADFTIDYETGIDTLIQALHLDTKVAQKLQEDVSKKTAVHTPKKEPTQTTTHHNPASNIVRPNPNVSYPTNKKKTDYTVHWILGGAAVLFFIFIFFLLLMFLFSDPYYDEYYGY